MGVIYPSRTLRNRQAKPKRAARKVIVIAAAMTCVFVVANLLIAAAYRNRAYPNTSVAGYDVGNQRFNDIASVAKGQVFPEKISLAYESKKADVLLADIGIKADTSRTEASLGTSRSWLPLANMFKRFELAAPVDFDDIKLQAYGEKLLPVFHRAATNATLSRAGDTFKVVKGKDGYDISISRLKAALIAGIDNNKSIVTAPVSFLPPKYSDQAAAADVKAITAAIGTPIALKAANSTVKPTAADIADWYVQTTAGSYALDDAAIRQFILKASIAAGTRPQNLTEATTKAKAAVAAGKPLTMALVPFANTKTFRYCTALRGVDTSNHKALQAAASDAFNDPRGWGLEGQVIFEETNAASGACEFTVWLTAADQMPSFGAICDPEWSCRIGPNVVINFTRWQETSPAWKRYGGTVENYRAMAINHETGHWFGFEHSTCPAGGQAAPVMMQQSIELGGCSFNPWPSARELAVYRSVIGL